MGRVGPSAFASGSVQDAPRRSESATDSSEHSYTLEDVQVVRRASTQGSAELNRPSLARRSTISVASGSTKRAFSIDLSAPSGRGSVDLRVALKARQPTAPPMPQFPESRPASRETSFDLTQLRNRLASPARSEQGEEQRPRHSDDTFRLDIPPPAGLTVEDIEEADAITGRIVRKRRRLPVPVVVVFGLTTCVCFCLGCVAVTLGSLNYSRIAKGKAAKSVADLDDEITPLIHGIYNITVGNVTAASHRMTTGLRRLW